MKFVTFEVRTVLGPEQRIGVLCDEGIIDLNATYAAFLRDASGIYRWKEVAQSLVPADMLAFIGGGELSKGACLNALEYFSKEERQKIAKTEKNFYMIPVMSSSWHLYRVLYQ